MEIRRGALYLLPNLLDQGGEPSAVLPASAIARVRALRRFVVEGEKAAWRLLSRLLTKEEAAEVRMERLDEHSRPEDLPPLLEPLERGEDLGLLSEAGMPCIADPGAALAALAHDRGLTVKVLSGPSSITLALAASGMNGQSFAFLGYLPAEPAARRSALAAIERGVAADGATRIFIETPYRNDRLLADCLSVLSPQTRLCVAAALTAPEERIRSAPVAAWKARPWELGKAPAIFLVGREARLASDDAFARAASAAAPPRRADRRPDRLDRERRSGHSNSVCQNKRR